ncbi:MAG: hypothetical protein IT539_10675 [Bradyrhizobiaceae bacterium]|nr:hypothetical protein [Bradyrhizobiaceae bacterium]
MTRDDILQKIRETSARLGKSPLSFSEFQRETGITQRKVYSHFDGWREACEAAGIEAFTQNIKVEDDQLLEAMRQTFIECGGIVTVYKFGRKFPYSVSLFDNRFGGWNGAKAALAEWIQKNGYDFPHLDELLKGSKGSVASTNELSVVSSAPPKWESQRAQQYGEFLNFRGLQHAPINEQGVVFLFGMIAHEIGYRVEAVQQGFPDCEAKRHVGGGRWERVRIEFEYQARTFHDHGHDPSRCDVIVCWENNWSDAPIEVLALRDVISKLEP